MSDNLKPCIQERYASATLSSNLRDNEHCHIPEILAAMAMSGDIGSLLLRVKYALDASSYQQLRNKWCEKIKEIADKEHWPTNLVLRKVVMISLDYWINDKCGNCNAVFFDTNGDICGVCDGTGVKPIECDSTMNKYLKSAMHTMQCLADESCDIARRKLRY